MSGPTPPGPSRRPTAPYRITGHKWFTSAPTSDVYLMFGPGPRRPLLLFAAPGAPRWLPEPDAPPAAEGQARQQVEGETSYYRPQIITCRELNQQGKFGTIFYSEAEYHHEGLLALMFDERGYPTWRYGLPPMLYPTHSVGMVVPVTGERLVEVQAVKWGDKHEVLQSNEYNNPFWNTTGFFKTSGGHASRIGVAWHVADKETERGSFYGDRMSYILQRPEGSPDAIMRIEKQGKTVIDSDGYPEGTVEVTPYKEPTYWDRLPPSMRVPSGHGGSQVFLTHEFISAIKEDRLPAVNVWEAIAYTLPGIVAHQSALHDGELLKIKDYGKAPA